MGVTKKQLGWKPLTGILACIMLTGFVAHDSRAQESVPAQTQNLLEQSPNAPWAAKVLDFIRTETSYPVVSAETALDQFSQHIAALPPEEQLRYWDELAFTAAFNTDDAGFQIATARAKELAETQQISHSPALQDILDILNQHLSSGQYNTGFERLNRIAERASLSAEDRIRLNLSRALLLYWDNRFVEAGDIVRETVQFGAEHPLSPFAELDIIRGQAYVYFRLEDPERTSALIIQETTMAHALGLPVIADSNPYNSALLLLRFKEYSTALAASEILMKDADTPRYGVAPFEAYYYCGSLQNHLGNYTKAADCFEEALKRDHPAEAMRAAALKLLIKSEISAGDPIAARRNFNKINAYPSLTAIENEVMDVAEVEVSLLKLEGRYQDALEKLEELDRYRAQTLRTQKLELTDNQLRYLSQESERLAERANLLQTRTDLQKRTIGLLTTLTIAFGGLLLLAGAFVVYSQSKRRELAEARDEARRMSEVKSRFLANMSHEVRTPMNGILGLADALERTAMSRHQSELVVLIRRSGQLLTKVLDDILDLSRIESEAINIQPDSFSPAELFEDTRAFFQASTDRRRLELMFDQDVDPALRVSGDAARIRQVIYNLISNAVKFTERGRITVRHWLVRPDPASDKASLHFSVTDTGQGIPADKIDEIFDPFIQGDQSSTRKFGGLGLGLAISKQLVERMGGSIAVTSTPGDGSHFSFRVPVEILPQSNIPEVPASTSETVPQGNLRILVAEDHPMNRRVIEILLSEHGITPVVAEDGLEAVQIYKTQNFDLVLLDIQMPEMDGIEALRAMRMVDVEQSRTTPTYLAFTANVMTHQVEEYMSVGFDGVLPKPIESSELAQTLQTVSRAA